MIITIEIPRSVFHCLRCCIKYNKGIFANKDKLKIEFFYSLLNFKSVIKSCKLMFNGWYRNIYTKEPPKKVTNKLKSIPKIILFLYSIFKVYFKVKFFQLSSIISKAL